MLPYAERDVPPVVVFERPCDVGPIEVFGRWCVAGWERLYVRINRIRVLRLGIISEDGTMSDDLLFKNRYRIPSARHAGWDYRWAGIYSVTIRTREWICWFGEVQQGQVLLSPIGKVVAEEWEKIPSEHPWVALDEWVIMPDHMHGLLVFQGKTPDEPDRPKHLLAQSLGAVIGRFKSEATKRIWRNLRQQSFAWQPRFHDVIVRDSAHLEKLRAYIQSNPTRWQSKRNKT